MQSRLTSGPVASALWLAGGAVAGFAIAIYAIGPGGASELNAGALNQQATPAAAAEVVSTPVAAARSPSPSIQATPRAAVAPTRTTVPPTPTRRSTFTATTLPTPTRTSTPSPLPTATAAAANYFVEDPLLRARVTSIADQVPGVVGVAIKDLGTGRGLLLNADERYPAASLFKAFVMYEVFKQREEGTLSFDEGIVVSGSAASYDLGGGWPAGSWMTLGTALERMITISDNTSAVMLLGRVGPGRLHADLADMGMEHTYISDPTLTTSPHDLLRLLEPIARGEGVNRQASAEMVHLLLRQEINDRLPVKLPSSVQVAHKTGDWGAATHDAGIVYTPRGTFVIVVMTRDLGNVETGKQAIVDISRSVYDYFQQLPIKTAAIPVPSGEYASYYSAPRLAPARAPASRQPDSEPAPDSLIPSDPPTPESAPRPEEDTGQTRSEDGQSGEPVKTPMPTAEQSGDQPPDAGATASPGDQQPPPEEQQALPTSESTQADPNGSAEASPEPADSQPLPAETPSTPVDSGDPQPQDPAPAESPAPGSAEEPPAVQEQAPPVEPPPAEPPPAQ